MIELQSWSKGIKYVIIYMEKFGVVQTLASTQIMGTVKALDKVIISTHSVYVMWYLFCYNENDKNTRNRSGFSSSDSCIYTGNIRHIRRKI